MTIVCTKMGHFTKAIILCFISHAILLSKAQHHEDFQSAVYNTFLTQPADILGILQNFNIGVVSPNCSEAMLTFGRALMNMDLWALEVLDAFGKLGSGVTEGNFIWPGSYRRCTSITGNGTDDDASQFNPHYCWSHFNVKFSDANPPNTLRVGLCMPGACSNADLKNILVNFNKLPANVNKFINFTDVKCISSQQDILKDDKAVTALIFCAVVVGFIGIATLYDIYLQYGKKEKSDHSYLLHGNKKNSDPIELELTHIESAVSNLPDGANSTNRQRAVKVHKKGRLSDFFLCFSLYTNVRKMFDSKVPQDSLSCLNGIRVLSMAWIILGHTYITGGPMTDNILMGVSWMQDFSFLFVMQGVLAVDTFFVLSGLLVMYLYLREYDKTEGKISWIKFYLHRYLRLTPVYVAVMFLFEYIFSKYYSFGPFWPQVGFDFGNCEKTWWWNVLYINNFLDGVDMCMGHTWYLANDMQFYVISPLILIFVVKHLPMAGFISGSLMIASWMCTLMIITMNNFNKSAFITEDIRSFDYVYTKPYCRIAPYIIGMYCGYLLHHSKRNFKLNKMIVLGGWVIAIALSSSVTLGIYESPMSRDVISMYLTFYRSVWAIALSWLIFACCNGYGGIINNILSWSIWQPLSRLTYSAFLIHFIIVRVYFTSMNYPPHFSHLFLIYTFVGNFVFTYLSAIPISLAFESPLLAVEKLFFRKA